jgi:hypothetical protein
MLIVACFETNIIYLSFYGVLQMKNGFFFNFIDTINISITILFIFIVVFYGVFFNVRLYIYDRKNLSFFLSEKISNLNSTVLHSIIIGLKNMSEGILHAVFLGNVKFLMPSLILVKLLMISSCIFYRKCFVSSIVCLFHICYFGIGICIDSFIFYHKFIQSQYFSG